VSSEPATDPTATGPITRPRRRPESLLSGGNSVTVEVLTLTGRAAAVELQIRPEQVEIRHHLRPVAVFERATLRDWLAAPERPLAAGEAIFTLDRMIDVDGRVAISLPDVQVWPLSPRDLETLRRRI
jgi:hypothetical protein